MQSAYVFTQVAPPVIKVHLVFPVFDNPLHIAAFAASLAPVGVYPVQLAAVAIHDVPSNRHVLKYDLQLAALGLVIVSAQVLA